MGKERQDLVLGQAFLIPPGQSIKEFAQGEGMSDKELSKRLGISEQSLYRIYKGDQVIAPETAYRLEIVTGVQASFWNNLEANYRTALTREKMAGEAQKLSFWMDSFPVCDLERRGYLTAGFRKLELGERMHGLLRFLGVASMSAFESLKEMPEFAARAAKGCDSDINSLLAWIRIAEVESNKARLPEYTKESFRSALKTIRSSLPRLDGNETFENILRELKEVCEKCGVSVEFIRKLSGMRKVNGVARRKRGGNPLIVLSLSGKRADSILFSFFHEASHILNDKGNLLYVSSGESSVEEDRAESFARDFLLPKSADREILASAGARMALSDIAHKYGIYTGIVFGRYQYLTKRWNMPFPQKTFDWGSADRARFV